MSFIDGIRYRLRALTGSGQHTRDVNDEVRHHLDLEAADVHASKSTTPADAAYEARRLFGNVAYYGEERRRIAGLALIDSVGQDVSFLSRLLRRRSGFAVVTIVTIALGIGAATSIFSVADAVLFRPLAFPDANRLVTVWLERPNMKSNPALIARWNRGPLSLPLARDWRARQTSFVDVGVWSTEGALVGPAGGADEVTIGRVSASLFPVLGIHPELGAWFTETDDVVGGPPVAVVSHATWMAHFGGDSHILGRTIEINGLAHTIVAVMPPGISLDRGATPVAYWTPVSERTRDVNDAGSFGYNAIARLKPNASLATAGAEVRRFFSSVSEDDRVTGATTATLHADQTRTVRRPLLLLLGASGLLLIIACINVATLLLGEAQGREYELRTRTALGASRARVMRQLLTESVMLAGAGAVAGAVVAWAGTKLIVRVAPPTIPGLADVRVDARVLIVALVVATITGLLFGLAPAISLSRPTEGSAFGGVKHTARGRGRGQRTLIACEVALSMVLLVGAGLLVRSFDKLSAIGFQADNLLIAGLRLPRAPFTDSVRARVIYTDVMARLATLHSVAGVAATTAPPFYNESSSGSFEIEGRPPVPDGPSYDAQRRLITPEFFAVTGIPILAGRGFASTDRGESPLVVVVSRAMARHWWPSESPVGKRINFGQQWRTIVGVAGDIENERPSGDLPEIIYGPMSQMMLRGTPSLLIRTRPGAGVRAVDAIAEIRAVVRGVDPAVQVRQLSEMDTLVADALADDRLRTVLISIFAAIAALLAAIGTYGVASSAASRRTREMAIRAAIGAPSGSIGRLIAMTAAQGVAAGAFAGVALALAGTRALAPYLYGVRPTDPVVFVAVALLLAATTVAATWVPARRAMRVRVADALLDP